MKPNFYKKVTIFVAVFLALNFVIVSPENASAAYQTNTIFARTLQKGSFGNEVKKLQEVLSDARVGGQEIYPEKLTTGYFGNLTRSAVQRFQKKYNIVSYGDEHTTGYGRVGPKTRAKLNELLSFLSITSTSSAFSSVKSLTNNLGTTQPGQRPKSDKCPDGTWDEAEQKDLNLCPADNPKGVTASSTFPATTVANTASTTQTQTVQQTQAVPTVKFTWTKNDGIRVSGALVPYVHKLNDGRFRMYYCGTSGGIMSATSYDGLAFQTEGTVLSPIYGGSETIICDPTLVDLPDGRVRLYYKGTPTGGVPAIHKIFSAISSNGLDFQKEGLVIDSEQTDDRGWASVPDAIMLPDGRVRLYYVSAVHGNGIVSAISSDGLNFTKEETKMTGWVDPSIIQLADGTFLLVVATFTPQGGTGLYYFPSNDGINFDKANPQIIIEEMGVADPSIEKIDDKIYRVYYWNVQDSTPVVYSITGVIR